VAFCVVRQAWSDCTDWDSGPAPSGKLDLSPILSLLNSGKIEFTLLFQLHQNPLIFRRLAIAGSMIGKSFFFIYFYFLEKPVLFEPTKQESLRLL
jgi:hypothetical protein